MKGLLIAEKPSVMRAVEGVYNTLPNSADTLEFAAFHGHLMKLKEPDDIKPEWGSPWSEKQLPMVPERFEYIPADPKSAGALIKRIREGGFDFLVNACDAGREGELIFWSFYEAYQLKLPVKRYWANSNTKPAIEKALRNLLPASRFEGLRTAAKIRAELDWLTGMNFTRAISVSTNSEAYVGRVMSPVQKIVVDRELEIRGFKPETFWELKAVYQTESGETFETVRLLPPKHVETRHPSKEEAEKVRLALQSSAKVVRVKETERTIHAPTLFSQTELQKSANKTYKLSPDKTLAIAQKLYEEGLITYPRTESRYLPSDMVPEIPAHLRALYRVPDIGDFAKRVTAADIGRATTGKTYVDDGRIEDHHAIIPTDQEPEWAELGEDEQKIYYLIARQFVAIFMPPYRAKTTAVLVQDGKILFRADGIVELDKGYTALAKGAKSKEARLPELREGQSVALAGSKVTESVTKPPPRYTPDTLLAAMQNAGKFVSDANQRAVLREAAGLGTAATRAPILKKMIDHGDLVLEKNQYRPSEYAIGFVRHYGGREFCSPAMTANWEEKLRAVERGSYPGDLRREIREYVAQEVATLLSMQADLRPLRFPCVGACPKCGNDVLSKKSYYVCKSYKAEEDPCDFIVPKLILGAGVSEEEMGLLLDGQRTVLKELTKKDGTKFKAAFYINEKQEIGLAFPRREDAEGLGECPCCRKGIVVEGKDYYVCTRRSNGCAYAQNKSVMGASLTPGDMKTLLAGKKTRAMTFTWRSGKQGRAALKLKAAGKLDWIFDV